MPCSVGRDASRRSSPFLIQGLRSTPMLFMLRTSCAGDSSKAKYRQRSPRAQAALAKCAARLVLPVPAVPETSTELPR